MFGNRGPNNHINYGYSGQMMHQVPMDVRWQQQNGRNQQYPYPAPPQNFDWNAYQQQGSYYPNQFQPYGQNPQPGYIQANLAYPNHSYPQKDTQFLFQNPLQPQNDKGQKAYMPMNGYPMMNPYPKQQSIIPKQPGGMQSFMNSFKSQDGSVDFNKMMNTAGQMMNAVNQVTSLVKGFGGFFKV
jgi:hypothetical protein